MKKIKCIITKGYKLTENNDYDVIREEDNFFIINNDNNKVVRYAKELFEEIEDNPIAEEEAAPQRGRRGPQIAQQVAPPPPPPLTLQEIIDSIKYNNNTLIFKTTNRLDVVISNNFDTNNATSASCGINDVSGINSTEEQINDIIIYCFDDLNNDDQVELSKVLFKKCISNFVLDNENTNREAAFSLLSTTADLDIEFQDALSDLSVFKSEIRHNPNSDNMIIVWMCENFN